MKTSLYDRVEGEELVLSINEDTFRECKSAKSVLEKHEKASRKYNAMPVFYFDFETFQCKHEDDSVYMEPYQVSIQERTSKTVTFNSITYPDLVPSLLNHVYEIARKHWKRLITCADKDWLRETFGNKSFFIPRVIMIAQ